MSPEEMRDAREGLHAAVRAAMGRIDAVSLPTGRARLSDSPSMASLRLQLAAMDGRWEECARWRDALGAMNVPCVDYTAVYGGEEGEETPLTGLLDFFSRAFSCEISNNERHCSI